MGSPRSISLAGMAEGGGDVRSTDDVQDNITWAEGMDITIMNVSDNDQATELMKTSNQESVQREINRLSQKKRKDMSSLERVRLLQLKLYLKAKQEKSYKFYILYDKLSLDHVLTLSYARCKFNDGSP